MDSKKCRAKDPSKCRMHGTPEATGSTERLEKAVAARDAEQYLKGKMEPANTSQFQVLTGDTPLSGQFKGAPLWRKSAVVTARQLAEPQALKTMLSNGLVETSRDVVEAGNWIITNPSGEEYAITDEKFKKLYEGTKEDGRYQAKGIIRAYQNPTGNPVEITAPWGEKQYGDENCWFAAGTDDQLNPTEDRYIIGDKEFRETYGTYSN